MGCLIKTYNDIMILTLNMPLYMFGLGMIS